jgi:hypothetical protein
LIGRFRQNFVRSTNVETGFCHGLDAGLCALARAIDRASRDRNCKNEAIDAVLASTQTAIDLSGKSDAHPHRRKSPRRTSVAGFAVKGVSGC